MRDLTQAELQKLGKLFKGLVGRWGGSAIEVECQGTPENLTKKEIEYSVQADMELDSKGELRIELSSTSSAESTDREDRFSLHLVDNRLRVEDENPRGDVEILHVGEGKVSFMKKTIHRTQRGGVATVENVTIIVLTGLQLQAELTSYTNGVLSATKSFELKRK